MNRSNSKFLIYEEQTQNHFKIYLIFNLTNSDPYLQFENPLRFQKFFFSFVFVRENILSKKIKNKSEDVAKNHPSFAVMVDRKQKQKMPDLGTVEKVIQSIKRYRINYLIYCVAVEYHLV